ncbi:MAG: CYTH and CHAD domain-containing protein [Mycobacterium sp.]
MGSKSGGSGPQRHIEVERKFDVAQDAVTPCFDGLAAVERVEHQPTQALDAVYFDTAGHDLALRRITLRRRTGGPDSGWHLKLPAGADSRSEIRLPLDAPGSPPAELVDVVLAIVRDRPLIPVAGISTVRNVTVLFGADDARLAEFCDDEVTARAFDPSDGAAGPDQRWHEWELELGGSNGTKSDARLLDQLGDRLVDAGGAPAGHGSKLAKVLDTGPAAPSASPDPVHRAVARHVEELLEWDRAVRADVYDSVHQMRVTTRKIRSLLQASRDVFGLTDDSWVLDELRQLASVLGVARDAEVLAERYSTALDALPAELVRGPVRERLVEGARRRYQTGLRRTLTAMRSPRYFRLLDALDQLVAADPVERGTSHAQSLDSAYKRVRKAAKSAATAAKADRDEALHRIRKGAKRLRYVAAATGKSKVADRAKSIQTLLGEHQDSVVSRTHLSQESAAAHTAGEDTFTYGLLYQRETDLAQQCRDELDAALAALRKSVRKAR